MASIEGEPKKLEDISIQALEEKAKISGRSVESVAIEECDTPEKIKEFYPLYVEFLKAEMEKDPNSTATSMLLSVAELRFDKETFEKWKSALSEITG